MAEQEGLLALAALAGQTVAQVAPTGAWEEVKKGIAQVLGCGNAETMQRAEGRLEKTRAQLKAAPSLELGQLTARLGVEWQVRLTDLLEDHPEVAENLQAVVNQMQTHLVQGAASSDIQGVEVRGESFAGSVGSEMTPGIGRQEAAGNPT